MDEDKGKGDIDDKYNQKYMCTLTYFSYSCEYLEGDLTHKIEKNKWSRVCEDHSGHSKFFSKKNHADLFSKLEKK